MAEHTALHLVIASVGENFFDGPASSATIPTSGGEITVLAHHEPLVATLKPGKIVVRANAEEPKYFDVESGIVEISGNRAVVLL